MPNVAFAGSRDLSREYEPIVAEAVSQTIARGHRILSGCATGADEFALRAALERKHRASAFAIGNVNGDGFCRDSSMLFMAFQGQEPDLEVHWLAGGPLTVALRTRLVRRTKAIVEAADVLVAFFGSPGSRGTLLSCRMAAERPIPIFAFPCGNFTLPSLHPQGEWVPGCDKGLWSRSYQWLAK